MTSLLKSLLESSESRYDYSGVIDPNLLITRTKAESRNVHSPVIWPELAHLKNEDGVKESYLLYPLFANDVACRKNHTIAILVKCDTV